MNKINEVATLNAQFRKEVIDYIYTTTNAPVEFPNKDNVEVIANPINEVIEIWLDNTKLTFNREYEEYEFNCQVNHQYTLEEMEVIMDIMKSTYELYHIHDNIYYNTPNNNNNPHIN